jgi:hypothetical protein
LTPTALALNLILLCINTWLHFFLYYFLIILNSTVGKRSLSLYLIGPTFSFVRFTLITLYIWHFNYLNTLYHTVFHPINLNHSSIICSILILIEEKIGTFVDSSNLIFFINPFLLSVFINLGRFRVCNWPNSNLNPLQIAIIFSVFEHIITLILIKWSKDMLIKEWIMIAKMF